jgi:hypothetical protein
VRAPAGAERLPWCLKDELDKTALLVGSDPCIRHQSNFSGKKTDVRCNVTVQTSRLRNRNQMAALERVRLASYGKDERFPKLRDNARLPFQVTYSPIRAPFTQAFRKGNTKLLSLAQKEEDLPPSLPQT